MKKYLDLTEDCILTIELDAKKTKKFPENCFKFHAEAILENYSENIALLDIRTDNIIEDIIRPMLRDEVNSDDLLDIRNGVKEILSKQFEKGKSDGKK